MPDTPNTTKSKPIRLGYYMLGLAALWSAFIASSLIWNLKIEKTSTYEAARIEARTAFRKDVIYRRWNAQHGGVYVPVSAKTQPNPYLDVSEREIKTPSGKKLTKINPGYMTRQVHEMAMQIYGVKGHITSLNPIRPANAPDPWETIALQAFRTGTKEFSSVEIMEGESYMRLTRPLFTEKGCLKCHSAQGYKTGDIRGGISVAVPMAPLLALERTRVYTLFVGIGFLGLLGLAGIGMGTYLLDQQILRRELAEKELLHHEKLQGVIEMAGAVCHEMNQPLMAISGYSELILMDLKEKDPLGEKLIKMKEQIDRLGQITRKLMHITKYETKDYIKSKIIDIDKASIDAT